MTQSPHGSQQKKIVAMLWLNLDDTAISGLDLADLAERIFGEEAFIDGGRLVDSRRSSMQRACNSLEKKGLIFGARKMGQTRKFYQLTQAGEKSYLELKLRRYEQNPDVCKMLV